MESSLFDEDIDPESFTETILNQSAPPETFKLKILLDGEIELAKEAFSQFSVSDAEKLLISEPVKMAGYADAAAHIISYIAGFSTPKPEIIAHRIVHGGQHLLEHCFINDKVMRQLEAAADFAPLHHQAAFDVIEYTQNIFAGLPQVACFDTAFHANMPDIAKQLPLNKKLKQEGIHRYGFHGISGESIVRQLTSNLPNKLIIAHLGSGCSVTAVKNGQSVDTSMGLTPTGGVMMGTRCGDLDPSIFLYLLQHKNYSIDDLNQLINHQSGLFGVSGLSSDMRVLHDAATVNQDAKLAIDMFCSAVAKQIAAMITVLEGLDTLVFTGGIGENDDLIRADICKKLTFFNINILSEKSGTTVLVCPSKENEQIARNAFNLQECICI